MKQFTIILSILFCIFLSGCTQKPTVIKINNSDFDDISSTSITTGNGHQYGIINLAASDYGYCRITVEADAFTFKNNKISSNARSNKNLAVNCHWNDRYYIQSKTFQTSASISILNLHENDHKGTMQISFKLINVPHNEYLEASSYISSISEDKILSFIKKA